MTPFDTSTDEGLLDFIDSTGKSVEPLGPPGFFHNFGDGSGGSLMAGLARTARAGTMLAAPFAIGVDTIHDAFSGFGEAATQAFRPRSPFGPEPATEAPGDAMQHIEAQDRYFEHVVGATNDAVDFWTPDAANVGTAGRVFNGLLQGLVPLTLGGPAPLVATLAGDVPAELVNQGVDSKTALAVGLSQAAATAVGFRLPAAVGSNLATRLATGAGGNLALGEGTRQVSAKLLDAAGQPDLAQQHRGDATERLVDVGMGAVFGAAAHLQAPRVTRAQRDALLTVNNAEHFSTGTMPGTAVDGVTATAHNTLMETAVRQLLDGQDVNLADAMPDVPLAFVPKQRTLFEPASTFNSAVDDVLRAEGGFVHDPIDRGGATNFGISSRAHPGVDVANLTREQAKGLYRREYWDAIDAEQLPDAMRGVAFDAAVNQGVGWTKQALRGAGGDRAEFLQLREARYREIVANDPSQAKFLRGWLNRLGAFKETSPAGHALRARLLANPEQLTREYAALKDSKGGTVLNTDVARELSPEYLVDRTRSADVHEAASDTIKTIYEDKLAQPTPAGFDRTVVFTAGGTGAGKSTSIGADSGSGPEIIYDTNMSTLASAIQKIDQALAAGRDAKIAYTFRDPVEALRLGALPRAMRQEAKFGSGRTVPMSEHADTHVGAGESIRALAKHYAGNPRVEFRFVNNARGKGQHQAASLADLPNVEQNGLHERLRASLDEAHAAGEISDAVYRGFLAESSRRGLGTSALGQPQSQRDGGARGRLSSVAARDPGDQNAGTVAGDAAAGNLETGARRGDQVTAGRLDPAAFPVQGNTAEVVTERGLTLPVRWAVVEADTLVTSHDDALQVNPDFPADLQPRDRTRAASETQIAKIANAINPELLAESPKAADGAPIIGADKVVESGNARTIALRRAYSRGKGEAYRSWLREHAARFGLDPGGLEGLRAPVLVRVATGAHDRAEFARQANESSVASLSATEQSQSDVGRLPDLTGLAVNNDGTINADASATFVRGFLQALPTTEHGTLLTAGGGLSQVGVARIRNAVFAKAYGDPDLVAMMAEATDANVKNVLAGLLRAAPAMAKLREMIAEGGRYGPDITPDLVIAVRKFSQLRSEGTTVDQFLAQGDMLGGGIQGRARDLLRSVGELSRAPKQFAEFLQRHIDAVDALGDPNQTDLLGGAKPDVDAMLDRARQDTATANAPRPTADLFGIGRQQTAALDNRAALEAIAANPDLVVMDADGNTRLATDVLADIDAEAANTAREASAIEAAAECFLRNAA